jgi:CBS domain-containing protein
LRRQIIPEVVHDQELAALKKTATVLDAARLMSKRSINSILVMDGDVLEGIFTARDLVRRVIAADLSLDTLLGDAMTADPETIGPTETPIGGLRRMFEGGFRHLPVVADGKVLGVISRRDLFREEKELIDQ